MHELNGKSLGNSKGHDLDIKSKVKVINEVMVIQKNEKCGKLADTCGESKISFSKLPYKFDIFAGLSHFVVAESWCRGIMYVHPWPKETGIIFGIKYFIQRIMNKGIFYPLFCTYSPVSCRQI